MEIDCTKLKIALQNLKITSKIKNNKIDSFLRLCSPKPKDVDEVLFVLSDNIIDPNFTEHIGFHFSYLLLLIIPKAILSGSEKNTHENFRKNCVALSKLIKFSPDVLKYSYSYFNHLMLDKTTIRSIINIKETDTADTSYLKSVVDLLKYDVSFFKNIWNISEFFDKFFGKNNSMHDYLILQMLSIITEMKKNDIEDITKIIPAAEFLLENNITQLDYELCNFDNENNAENVSYEQKLVKTNFINNAGISIEGILLPLSNIDYFNFYQFINNYFDKIVNVESTKLNLRSIAIGISAKKAICLSGPVGSGKTSLVEYLAKLTGRMAPKLQEFYYYYEKQYNNKNKIKCDSEIAIKLNESKRKLSDTHFDMGEATSAYENFLTKNEFLRIQLGEQTDSKVLLGQYCCTEVPGEFVWQPGVLVQAVINGYWLLLEDLDLATQDVCTLLTNLLENNYLSVPGYKDYVPIHHGFQLFVTIRTTKQINTAHQLIFSMLDKYLYTINLLPLSRNELCQIICENYPKLTTVASRIVDVYLTFSSGVHNNDDENNVNLNIEINQNNSELKLTPGCNSGRLVSTRDLLKLCKRSHDSFIITSVDCAYSVFQNAVDLFCSHLPNGDTKLKLITSIGSKLGIIKSRCEFLEEEYKPDVEINIQNIKIGRCKIDKYANINNEIQNIEKRTKVDNEGINNMNKKMKSPTFSFTRLALCLLERISLGVQHNEPILLVGETGVGKTSSVQYLAHQMNRKLVVVNMNNQSDVSDLLGGFKPVDLKYIMSPLRSEFELLFRETYNVVKNEKFLHNISVCYNHGDFKILVQLMLKIIDTVNLRFSKKTNNILTNLFSKWEILKIKLLKLYKTMMKPNSINISFSFISGTLVNCIKNGDWILLDEINLASTETLECLSTILEPNGSVILLEKGDIVPIKRHPDFRIFSCMNPSTDVGKKDLSIGIRNRFTEFFVDELLAENDLMILISDYLISTGIKKTLIFNVVKLYKKLGALAQLELNDGLGNRPVYSLRTLCRALMICSKNLCGSMERNLYESFCLSFLTQLDLTSHDIVLDLIKKYLISDIKAVLSQQIPKPNNGAYLNFEGYWIAKGPKEIQICESYILTNSVRKNLNDLARIISIGKLPILLQGPTSAGKTSLIEYIAKRSGNYCLRINNHEHTDLQEYIGTYTADIDGKLSFKEGVLVQAMTNGYWIILDELNLAPSDILEALNRVLDDNRELFIPETQTLIKAHPNFMLFATQNPPGLYGGRKTLSRAFKNRFIELHFSEIPKHELEIILEKRCLIPCSYSQKMVKTMSDLQINRKSTNKNTFTLRDLFRWGNRYTFADKVLLENKLYDWNQHLVDEGFLVLSAKIRNLHEENIIEEVLFANFRKKINIENLYNLHSNTSMVTRSILDRLTAYDKCKHIVWTTDMRRMAILTAKALAFNEPILLVGPTGCGKTTICQILADVAEKEMKILNCHMHTESADFLGGLRPYRGTNDGTLDSDKENNKKQLFEWANGPLIISMLKGNFFLVDEISLAEDSVLERLNCVLEPEKTILLAEKGGVSNNFIEDPASLDANEFIIKAAPGFQFLATMNPGGDFGKKELSPALRNRFTEIWCNATDSRADLILICESSLRLGFQIEDQNNVIINAIAVTIINTLFHMKSIINKFNFSIRDILAWINYITTNSNISELDHIEHEKISVCDAIVYGIEILFLDSLEMLAFDTYKEIEIIRKLCINYLEDQIIKTISKNFSIKIFESKRGKCVGNKNNKFGVDPFYLTSENNTLFNNDFMFESPTTQNNLFRVLSALSLKKAILLEGPPGVGKTTLIENIAKQIGYQLVRINLCEHTDVADLFGTDLPAENNILNNEITNSSSKYQLGSFVWRDGPLLSALKSKNTWILLDELNLAPQSVLEGLNAILDHRGEVFIPELNKVFKLNNTTRIFGAQNPLRQGGGRKGLPQSFLNRFTKVYLRKLNNVDLLNIINNKYSDYFSELKEFFTTIVKNENIIMDKPISIFDYINMQTEKLCKYSENNSNIIVDAENNFIFDLANRMVTFNDHLNIGLKNLEFGLKGGPFDINLRDILRWCQFLCKIYQPKIKRTDLTKGSFHFNNFLQILFEKMKLVYCERMRTENDRKYIIKIFGNIFNCDPEMLYYTSTDVSLYWTNDKLYLDNIDTLQISNEELYNINIKEVNKNIPLFLSSQIDKLKNLVECDNNKIPVILCGPSDCGKTKSVNLLSTIQSVMCNFDTVDESVTGSFQQMDLNRHLDLLSRNIELKLFECIHYCIKRIIVEPNIENHKKHINIVNLLNITYKYNNIQSLTNDKIDIENLGKSLDVILFEKQLNSLKEIICLIERENVITIDFSKENIMIKSLLNILQNLNTLNTGGYFEWVDSKFVKSMKMGELICLEHVNLCSPAILDRLNPCFESGYRYLPLTEKGVSEITGSIEIIKPNKDFNAFLTLDPKNGEISRAMRNRCIEIAFLNEKYSDDDLKQLIHEQGVREFWMIKAILLIHKELRVITDFSVFGVSHILRFAFLVTQNCRFKMNNKKALFNSAMEIYVRSSHIDFIGYGLKFFHSKLQETIEKIIQNVQPDINHFNYDNVILKANRLNEYSMIKLQVEPFLILIKCFLDPTKNFKGILCDLSENFKSINITMKPKLHNFLLYFLYNSSTCNDLTKRKNYIEKMLNILGNDLENMNLIVDILKTINSLYKIITKSKLYENIIKESVHTDLRTIPWNSILYPRIDVYDKYGCIDIKLQRILSAELLFEIIIERYESKSILKLKEISLINYSNLITNGKIQDKINDLCITHFYNFIDNFKQYFSTMVNFCDSNLLCNKQYYNLLSTYLWCNRFINLSKINLINNTNDINLNLIDTLKLHYFWFNKKFRKITNNINVNESNINKGYTVFQQIMVTLNDINDLNNKSNINTVRKIFNKKCTNYIPFYTDYQIIYNENLKNILNKTKLIDILKEINYSNFIKTVNILYNDLYIEIKNSLIDYTIMNQLEILRYCLTDSENYKNNNNNISKRLEICINKMSLLNIEKHEKVSMDCFNKFNKICELQENNMNDQVNISILPLYDYFGMKMLNTIFSDNKINFNYNYFELCKIFNHNFMNIIYLKKNETFLICQELWNSYEDNTYKDFNITDKNNYKHFINNRESLPNNFYSNFSALQNNIELNMNKLQSKSISVNNKVFVNNNTNNEITYKNILETKNMKFTNGIVLTDYLMNMLLNVNGEIVSAGLGDLNNWSFILKNMTKLLWQNIDLYRNDYNFENINLKRSINNSKKLLLDIADTMNFCNEKYEKKYYEDEYYEKLIDTLFVVQKAVEQNPDIINDRDKQMYYIGLLNAIQSSIEFYIAVYQPLVDPVEKCQLKKLYTEDEIDFYENLICSYDFTRSIMNYKSLGTQDTNIMHENISILKENLKKYSKKLAVRPEKSLYRDLVSDVNHYLNTCCAPNILYNLINTIDECLSASDKDKELSNVLQNINDIAKRIDLWISNSMNFEYLIVKKYSSLYNDFIQPIEYLIGKFQYSLSILKSCLMKKHDNLLYNHKNNMKINGILENLIKFPNINGIGINDGNNVCKLFKNVNCDNNEELLVMSLIKIWFYEIENNLILSENIENSFNDFDNILKVLNKLWQKQEDNKKKQQIEEDSLYVTKTKCVTEDEQAIINEEVEELFPNYVDQDFGEFIQTNTLEQIIIKPTKDNTNMKNNLNIDDDLKLICDKFINVMDNYSKSYYYDNKRDNNVNLNNNLDFMTPYKLKYGIFYKLYDVYKNCLSSNFDETNYISLSILLGTAQEKCGNFAFNDILKPYNIYKDSNVPEILNCLELLKRIERRVKVELEQWPDHATLNDIIKIINRIYMLPSSSSIVRFNTGFQLLRQKIDEWNNVAHRNNNLCELETEVSNYVQQWMRLELKCWRECLTQTYNNVEKKAYKFWFLIYNLIHEYLNEDSKSMENGNLFEKYFNSCQINTTDANNIKSNDIIKVIKDFIETSNYGEFNLRMKIIKAFEKYLTYINVKNESKKNNLISILYNIYLYYDQFKNEINEIIKQKRGPIEKKLKDYIKIQSYIKDLSYFSMRNNIASVHRNLHKFLKEYELILNLKVNNLFVNKNNLPDELIIENDKGKNLRHETKVKYYMIDVKNFLMSVRLSDKYFLNKNIENLNNLNLLSKMPKFFLTSRKIVNSAIIHMEYPNLIYNLDMLLSEQIETCEYLRKLEVDRSKEKAQQKSQAKSILQQKRKTLSDLYKKLKTLGINYRTGIMEKKLNTNLVNMEIRPFCVKMFNHFKNKKFEKNLYYLNENIDLYYNKCIFKLKLLDNILIIPHTDIDTTNSERMNGYSIDMFLLIEKQRISLSKTTNELFNTKIIINNLIDLHNFYINDNKNNTVNEIYNENKYYFIKSSIEKIRSFTEQYKIYLKCAPETLDDNFSVNINHNVKLIKSSEKYLKINSLLEQILNSCISLYNELMKQDGSKYFSINLINDYQAKFNLIMNDLSLVDSEFKFNCTDEKFIIGKGLEELITSLNNGFANLDAEVLEKHQKENILNSDDYNAELENIIHSILISMQKIYKKYAIYGETFYDCNVSDQTDYEDGNNHGVNTNIVNKGNDEDNDILENHLKEKINKDIEDDLKIINIEDINRRISNLLKSVKLCCDSKQKLDFIYKIIRTIPILEQYSLLGEYYLVQQFGAHKVATKMLSIMLSVFIELGTKGFCVPPDLLQDEDGQSKKQEQKNEGFGLDDGTGKNDVSDRIENEDQLDDAKKPNNDDDKDKDQDQDCKEEKGIDMSEDFDSKLQNLDKKDDESDESDKEEDNDEELDKEMDETEQAADKLDEQIWGSDEEKDEQSEEELNDDAEGKGSNEIDDQHNDSGVDKNEMNNKGEEDDGLDAADNDTKKEKTKDKDIDDQTGDEEQTNTGHNELEDPPEAEPLEINECNLDNNDADDKEENNEENPFDIDKMKEQMEIPEDNEENDKNENSDIGENEENNNLSSDDEDIKDGQNEPNGTDNDDGEEINEDENDINKSNNEQEENAEPDNENCDDKIEDEDDANNNMQQQDEFHESKDNKSKEDNVQSMPAEKNTGSFDHVKNENEQTQSEKMDTQDTGDDKDGVGQADNEDSKNGHQGVSESNTQKSNETNTSNENENKRKQGNTDDDRSLADALKSESKRLKTIDKLNKNNKNDNKEQEKEQDNTTDTYQHVKEAKSTDKTTLDNATEEQSKQIKNDNEHDNELDTEDAENGDELMDTNEMSEDIEDDIVDKLDGEKISDLSKKSSKYEDHIREKCETKENVDVDGEIVNSMEVMRGRDTTAHSMVEILNDSTVPQEPTQLENLEARRMYEREMNKNSLIVTNHEDFDMWQSISNKMLTNARELCEQLRLILEPTKCTRLKGDYRTGKRINMRKIIPYIASDYRKDKIWLRRTKPAQRDYKISIAIDDSKSMHHNNSKNLTLQAISLVSQALTLLESGKLSIVSFGEKPSIVLKFTDLFDGPKLVNSLNFSQNQSRIGELLDFIRIANSEDASNSTNNIFENLLIVLSDGRNIYSEGEQKVKNSVKLARLQRIFIVYIIIDNPENKHSILDIRVPSFSLDRKSITMKSYLDTFPFPYYVIVRDLNQLPIVLSDAMRQWFELVNSEQ